jgi:hypothetical protein
MKFAFEKGSDAMICHDTEFHEDWFRHSKADRGDSQTHNMEIVQAYFRTQNYYVVMTLELLETFRILFSGEFLVRKSWHYVVSVIGGNIFHLHIQI